MKRSQRVSFMLSSWLKQEYLPDRAGGTACVCIGCPDDSYAVRLAFLNLGDTPWTLDRLIGTASSGYGDFISPPENTAWSDFTAVDDSLGENQLLDDGGSKQTVTYTISQFPEILSDKDVNYDWGKEPYSRWGDLVSVARSERISEVCR